MEDTKPQPKKKPPKTPAEILEQKNYGEKIVALSAVDRNNINKIYKAVLKAAQYEAFQTDNQSFQLLEGKVKMNERGEYIFTPDKNLRAYLEKSELPSLLKVEEDRFIELIKLALLEVQEQE